MFRQMMRLQLDTARMMAEAQSVIGLRVMGMAAMTPASAAETVRMVTEKQTAFVEAGMQATGAMMRGASPMTMMEAALRPIGKTTRANARRLTRGQ